MSGDKSKDDKISDDAEKDLITGPEEISDEDLSETSGGLRASNFISVDARGLKATTLFAGAGDFDTPWSGLKTNPGDISLSKGFSPKLKR